MAKKNKAARTPEEIEKALAEHVWRDPELGKAWASLARAGLIVDTGRRRRGQVTRADRCEGEPR